MTEERDVYLTAVKVRKRFGDIAPVTLYRWIEDPEIAFPKPLKVGGRRFFKLKEIEEWEEKRKGNPT
jgi:predicted DNA-binding transcriptional regulator AlpA